MRELELIVLDIVMGILCIFLTITIVGLLVLPTLLRTWKEMRANKNQKEEDELDSADDK